MHKVSVCPNEVAVCLENRPRSSPPPGLPIALCLWASRAAFTKRPVNYSRWFGERAIGYCKPPDREYVLGRPTRKSQVIRVYWCDHCSTEIPAAEVFLLAGRLHHRRGSDMGAVRDRDLHPVRQLADTHEPLASDSNNPTGSI